MPQSSPARLRPQLPDDSTSRKAGERSPLQRSDWRYVELSDLSQFGEEDWNTLQRQRVDYLVDERSRQALEMLLAQRHVPTFGYQINNYEHCLQAATLAMEAGEDTDTVVVALFHDVGFIVCNESHGDFAAELLKPYVDPRHIWTLRRHMQFQYAYCESAPGIDLHYRERWRSHEYFDWADEFVRKYDLDAVGADYCNAPLSEFVPLVQEVFNRTPRKCPPD